MLLAHIGGRGPQPITQLTKELDAPWLDLIDPTEEEVQIAAQLTGQNIPSRTDLEEIESSSRLYMEDDAVYLSTPLLRYLGESFFMSPVGFVLSKDRLVTIRFTQFSSFEEASRQISQSKHTVHAVECALILLEAIVDRLADILENLGTTIDSISHDIFQSERKKTLTRKGSQLQSLLKRIGRCGDTASAVRDSLAGLDRIVIFIGETRKKNLSDDQQARWATLNRDIASLNDFVSQKSTKIQFLLDALLGFVSIEQNGSVNILTAVSLSGILPTLIAGIYGMNFKNMPELQWHYGYIYSLILMLLSIVVPLLWFWYKWWFGNKL